MITNTPETVNPAPVNPAPAEKGKRTPSALVLSAREISAEIKTGKEAATFAGRILYAVTLSQNAVKSGKAGKGLADRLSDIATALREAGNTADSEAVRMSAVAAVTGGVPSKACRAVLRKYAAALAGAVPDSFARAVTLSEKRDTVADSARAEAEARKAEKSARAAVREKAEKQAAETGAVTLSAEEFAILAPRRKARAA